MTSRVAVLVIAVLAGCVPQSSISDTTSSQISQTDQFFAFAQRVREAEAVVIARLEASDLAPSTDGFVTTFRWRMIESISGIKPNSLFTTRSQESASSYTSNSTIFGGGSKDIVGRRYILLLSRKHYAEQAQVLGTGPLTNQTGTALGAYRVLETDRIVPTAPNPHPLTLDEMRNFVRRVRQ